METDIAKVLAYEIKKELADRYFGFRTAIEKNKEELDRQIREQTLTVEQRLCLDLVRIYILLRDEDLIRDFLALAGLTEKIFFDPYLLESPTIRKRVFAGVRAAGFTMRARFTNLILNSYETLVRDVTLYRERFGDLLEERETIEEEIKLFYRKHDLGNIMTFLRSLDAPASIGGSGLDGGIGPAAAGDLEERMRVHPPAPIEKSLPIVPPLLPLRRIRRPLKNLAHEAYRRRVEETGLL